VRAIARRNFEGFGHARRESRPPDGRSSGTFVTGAALKLPNGNSLVAGTAADLPRTLNGERQRLVIARAERIIAGSKKCEPGRDRIGGLVDLLMLTRGEE
jgi:hypothetical protein